MAAENECSLFQALGKMIEEGEIIQKNVIAYYDALMELHAAYEEYSCTDIVNKCLDMGYREALEQDIDQTRLDNVSELIRTITAIEDDNQEKVELADLYLYRGWSKGSFQVADSATKMSMKKREDYYMWR